MTLLARAVDRSGRHENVPFAPAFVRSRDGRPPLARLVFDGGGRGGAVRLKLYLCITLMATGSPHDIKQPPTARAWARRLALPQDTGPRRVNNALKWLETNQLISLEPRVGAPAMIKLLSASGDGSPYVARGPRWISIPLGLWREGWLLDLSATALALLLVLMELQGGRDGAQSVPRERRFEYGLSADTWTRATKELVRRGLLTVGRTPQGDNEFVYNRMRNTYRVHVERLSVPLWGADA